MEDATYYRAQAERYRRMLNSVDDPKAREVLAGLINEANAKAGADETNALDSNPPQHAPRYKAFER